LNPSIDKGGLQLNIDTTNNALDFKLAKSVGEYFQLKNEEMDQIITEVQKLVADWRDVAVAV
jgi:serine/threonine-protein kinase HipA